MPAAVTLWAASLVAVYQDTLEMDLPVQVNKNILQSRTSLPRMIIPMMGIAYLHQGWRAFATPLFDEKKSF